MTRTVLARLGLLLGFCLFSTPIRAQEKDTPKPAAQAKTATTATPEYSVTTLTGGTRLVVLREPESPVVVTDVFFNVNRLDERKWPGINALIARIWGVESEWRSAALTQRDVSRIGSAGTDVGDDWVEIWSVSGPEPEQVAESLRTLLTNLVANPHFSPATLQSAKENQQIARELASDSVVSDALAALRSRVWGATPQAGSLLGTSASLQPLTADELTAYYRKHFRPERCVICIAGNVDPEQIKRKVLNSLGAGEWLSGPPAPPLRLSEPEKIPAGLRDRSIGRAAPSLVLMSGFIAPGTAKTEQAGGKSEYATLLLLDAVLTGGKSSRLFSTLRDEAGSDASAPLGYDLRSTVLAGQTQSLWAIYVVGDTPVIESRARLGSALQAITKDKPFTDEEVSRARAWLKVTHARERQRPRDRATGAGWAEVMGLGAAFDVNFDATMDAITTEDVNQLARRILTAPSAIVFSNLLETKSSNQPAPQATDTVTP